MAKRKRIVLRVVGNRMVGLGHIYRALALANEFRNFKVMFVTNLICKQYVEAVVKNKYWVGCYPASSIVKEIVNLEPDLVINDILDTKIVDVAPIKKMGIKTVSFEDLGRGATYTDLTINEIYDEPRFHAKHVLWGHKYFFLRDEFDVVRPHRFAKDIQGVMLTFGGTDQHDLTRKVFHAVKYLCEENDIKIHLVTGPGYKYRNRLMREIEDIAFATATHGSEVISGIMENVQLAITSNGRTVYEFAQMNIPAIVIAQHKREITHSFAKCENGFVPLGVYRAGVTEKAVIEAFGKVVCDNKYRRALHKCQVRHKFSANKKKVVKKLLKLID